MSDEFDEIIRQSGLEGLMSSDPEPATFTLEELHKGISSLNESAMYIMDFLVDYIAADKANVPVESMPTLSPYTIVEMKRLFKTAVKFCEHFADDHVGDEDDDA